MNGIITEICFSHNALDVESLRGLRRMTIEQKPFIRYNEEKKVDAFTVRLNKQERAMLEQDKKILQQVKDSTALKQMAWIGSNVLHDNFTGAILELIFKNKRRNKRLGIPDFD